MKIFNVVKFTELGGKSSTIEIVKTGRWDHPTYGEFTISEKTIDEMIKNFEDGVRNGVYITEGHAQEGEEKPAVGWITRLFKEDEGDQITLKADIDWNKKGTEVLENRMYKFFSPELQFNYSDPETGQEFNNILMAGALTNAPYFKELNVVTLSEKILITNSEKMPKDKKNEDKKMKEKKDKKKVDYKMKYEELKAEMAELKKGMKDKKKKKKVEIEMMEGKKKDKKMKASELKASEKMAFMEKQIKDLKFKEVKRKISDKLNKFKFSEDGGIMNDETLSEAKKFAYGLDREQRKAFYSLLEEMPKSNVFGEIGSDKAKKLTQAPRGVDQKSFDLDIKAQELMKEDKKLQYSDALIKANELL